MCCASAGTRRAVRLAAAGQRCSSTVGGLSSSTGSSAVPGWGAVTAAGGGAAGQQQAQGAADCTGGWYASFFAQCSRKHDLLVCVCGWRLLQGNSRLKEQLTAQVGCVSAAAQYFACCSRKHYLHVCMAGRCSRAIAGSRSSWLAAQVCGASCCVKTRVCRDCV
jgi:hypothetical protein